MTKTEIKEYVENLTGKLFPNFCKLSIDELKEIKQLAIDSEAFWNQGVKVIENGPIGCGPICEHGHNSLTCSECMDANL